MTLEDPRLPSRQEALALTRQSIELSGLGVSEQWKAEARQVVLQVADRQERFTANDIWKAGLTQPSNRRALGNVIVALQAEGVIRKVGTSDRSRWGHGQGISVWELASPVARVVA